jgi:flagellar basal body-associated protein FliL
LQGPGECQHDERLSVVPVQAPLPGGRSRSRQLGEAIIIIIVIIIIVVVVVVIIIIIMVVVCQVWGLNPDPNLHGTYIDVEPISGLTFSSRKRVQLNG